MPQVMYSKYAPLEASFGCHLFLDLILGLPLIYHLGKREIKECVGLRFFRERSVMGEQHIVTFLPHARSGEGRIFRERKKVTTV